jgi:hypothetical protein
MTNTQAMAHDNAVRAKTDPPAFTVEVENNEGEFLKKWRGMLCSLHNGIVF